KYADPPPQFAYIGRWCGFFMSLRGVALVVLSGWSYSPKASALPTALHPVMEFLTVVLHVVLAVF
ncbi:hypothetical protein, partial [Intestinimonas sp.]